MMSGAVSPFRTALALGAVLSTASVHPASALTCNFVADWLWQSQHASTTMGLMGLVQGLQAAVAGSLTMSNEMLVSAVKVNTEQVNADGQRLQQMKIQSNQALASSMIEQERAERIARIKEDYSIDTGQGVQACRTVKLFNGVNSALEAKPETAMEAVAALDVAPGSAKPLADAVQLRLQNLDKTDGAMLFDTSVSSDNKAIVIAQMAGLPPPKPGANVSGAAAEVMMQHARRVEALRSPALASLASVAAFNSRDSHGGVQWPVGLQGAYGGDASPSEALDALMDQYGGGSGYESWSAGLAGQSDRGLMIELTRLRAMSVKLRQADTEQRARLTALYATYLALEAGGL